MHPVIWHVPAVHVVPSTLPAQVVLQSLPQEPHALVLFATFVSQPSLTRPLQFPKSVLHDATVQLPAEQPATPLATVHTRPQTPQLIGLARLASQPSTGLLLQSANPALQDVIVQLLPAQPIVAFGAVQMWPQLPQLLASDVVETSHPSAT